MDGMVHVLSRHSVPQTLERLESAVKSRGLTIFGRIDQGAEAEKAGLEIRPAHLLMFGDPKAGIPLIAAAPTIALDLPLKALVWEDGKGRVRISYNSPEYLKIRHMVLGDLIENIAGIGALIESVAA
jgi:uncharacterized protein (DUF302 family)